MVQLLRSPSAMRRTQGSFNGKRHQSEVSCPLDGYRKLALMAGTVPGDTARNNLAPLGDQVAQAPHIFVVDEGQFIRAESTDLLAQKAPAFARRRFLFRRHYGHISHSPSTYQVLSGIPRTVRKEYRRPQEAGRNPSPPLPVRVLEACAPCLGPDSGAPRPLHAPAA